VKAVVNLAKDFGQQTIAEGVEDERTLDLVRELDVDFAQGYYMGRPGPLDTAGLLSGRVTRAG
jgi:EAL domain-containing protein (putative c-di-GMP-specific phosphodiesterase class I)